MRRRRWVRRVRTLSLAMLLASVGLWGVSEFRNVNASILQAHIWLDRGATLIQYYPGTDPDGLSLASWPLSNRLRGLHFPRFRYVCYDEFPSLAIQSYLITIPFWAASLLALAVWLPCIIWLRRKESLPGMCPNCGYNTSRCTEGRCSECGQPLPDASPVDATA